MRRMGVLGKRGIVTGAGGVDQRRVAFVWYLIVWLLSNTGTYRPLAWGLTILLCFSE